MPPLDTALLNPLHQPGHGVEGVQFNRGLQSQLISQRHRMQEQSAQSRPARDSRQSLAWQLIDPRRFTLQGQPGHHQGPAATHHDVARFSQPQAIERRA